MSSHPVQVGARILYQDAHIGTIRYVGPVQGAKGEWLGVEWDDAKARGKHDGIKDDHRYFHCVVPNAGSFIRYSPTTVNLGQSFLNALVAKYIDVSVAPPPSLANPRAATSRDGSAGVETVTLGSSKGLIEVEAPNLDRVRRKIANVERLKEMSLDGEAVADADDAEDPGWKMCKNVRGLNLSRSLVNDWDIIRRILVHLPSLVTLELARNRFTSLSVPLGVLSSSVRDLRLNDTLIPWFELEYLSEAFPNLDELQFGFNHLGDLDHSFAPNTDIPVRPLVAPAFPNLRILFLDGNELTDWKGVVSRINHLPRLEQLHLSSNRLSTIPSPTSADTKLKIHRLNLSSNLLSSWSDLDALGEWCPSLEHLAFTDQPVTSGQRHARQLITARISTLTILDGSSISAHERNDSELFYLSTIVATPLAEDERIRQHPRWLALCEKHGRPSEQNVSSDSKLSNKLVGITILAIEEPIEAGTSMLLAKPPHRASVDIRVLLSMSVKVLRLKIAKTLRTRLGGIASMVMPPKSGAASLRLWALLRRRDDEDSWIVRELTDELVELDFIGIEEGSLLAVLIT